MKPHHVSLLAAATIAAVMLAAGIHAAFGHGDAEWIMYGPYTDKAGAHCCGPSDCKITGPGELSRVPGGWRHVQTGSVLLDNEIGNYPSTDAQTWHCIRYGELKCVFPASGM